MWTPKLFINDSHFNYGFGSCEPTKCLIRNEAQVSCLFSCAQNARCTTDFTDWPFDVQTCTVVFRAFQSNEDASFDSDQISGSLLEDSNNRWKIIESKAKINVTDETNVKFIFVIKRVDELIFAHVLIPGYTLIVLTLSVLWMKHDSSMRSVVCGVSIYLHFNLMDRTWWQ